MKWDIDTRFSLHVTWKYFLCHNDVIKRKHFPRYWPFVRGIHRSPVNSPHKGQWCGALIFCLKCAWINGWVYNSEAGGLRRHRAHYDGTVMPLAFCERIHRSPVVSPDAGQVMLSFDVSSMLAWTNSWTKTRVLHLFLFSAKCCLCHILVTTGLVVEMLWRSCFVVIMLLVHRPWNKFTTLFGSVG